MSNQTSELELASLRKQQSKARHDEVFGGLSPARHSLTTAGKIASTNWNSISSSSATSVNLVRLDSGTEFSVNWPLTPISFFAALSLDNNRRPLFRAFLD